MIEDLEKKIDKIQADLQLIKKATALLLRSAQYETNINKGMIYSTMGDPVIKVEQFAAEAGKLWDYWMCLIQLSSDEG